MRKKTFKWSDPPLSSTSKSQVTARTFKSVRDRLAKSPVFLANSETFARPMLLGFLNSKSYGSTCILCLVSLSLISETTSCRVTNLPARSLKGAFLMNPPESTTSTSALDMVRPLKTVSMKSLLKTSQPLSIPNWLTIDLLSGVSAMITR